MIRITGGEYKGIELKTVPCKKTRYTPAMVRQALFNMVDVEGKSFLDLFCGSCIVLIEALSRGAKEGAAVDVSQTAISICKENLKKLNLLDRVRLYKTNAVSFVKSKGRDYDIIFMDPPYELGLVDKIFKSMRAEILKKNGIVIVELSKREKFTLPEYLEKIKEKTYGDTKVVILKRI